MAHQRSIWRDGRLMSVLGMIAGFAGAMLVFGVLYSDRVWAPLLIVCGVLLLPVLVLGVLKRRWSEPLYGTLLITAGGLLAGGIVLNNLMVISIAIALLVVIGATIPVTLLLSDALKGLQGGSARSGQSNLEQVLEQIKINSMLSDGAKRVLFRERELEMLRDAIREDIQQGRHDAALTLCEDLANLFGQREEAEHFRMQIMQAHQSRIQQQIEAGLAELDQAVAERQWSIAYERIARLKRLYPESHMVHGLEQRVEAGRDEHKQDLERRFLNAAQREEVEHAMALLKELDRYLTPQEAERLTEVAQGVVSKHRENLGVQFKLAVHDHQWHEAARVGQEIIREFPNSKMADEVRSMMEMIRVRATQHAVETAAT